MALNKVDPRIEELARDLARLTGETVTDATRKALEERLRRVGARTRKAELLADLAAIRGRWRDMPVLDARSPEEILGYDEHGLPGRW